MSLKNFQKLLLVREIGGRERIPMQDSEERIDSLVLVSKIYLSKYFHSHTQNEIYKVYVRPHLDYGNVKGPCATSLLCDRKYALISCDW